MKVLNVGERALDTIRECEFLRVRSVFSKVIYIQAEEEMVILSSLPERSCFTINILAEYDDLRCFFKRGELLRIKDLCIYTDREEINLNSALIYRQANNKSSFYPPSKREIRSFCLALALLYSAVVSRPKIIDDTSFLDLISSIGENTGEGINYEHIRSAMVRMVGRGTGFTPYCDDFIAGFLFAFNELVQSLGKRKILIDRRELQRRTIWESGMLIDYAQKGMVDELIHKLLFPDENRYVSVLAEIAKRGHTSGLDVSLGILLALALLTDHAKGSNELKYMLKIFGLDIENDND